MKFTDKEYEDIEKQGKINEEILDNNGGIEINNK